MRSIIIGDEARQAQRALAAFVNQERIRTALPKQRDKFAPASRVEDRDEERRVTEMVCAIDFCTVVEQQAGRLKRARLGRQMQRRETEPIAAVWVVSLSEPCLGFGNVVRHGRIMQRQSTLTINVSQIL